MRMSYEELSQIKEKYGVDVLWSFSRLGCYENSPFNYYLKYIKKEKEQDRSTIYTESGSAVHECLEKYYNGEIKYEDMLDRYEESLELFMVSGLKYNKTDEEKNANIANKYEDDIRHFFKNHIPFKYKECKTEEFLITKVKDFIFQGYCDFMYKDLNDDIHIVDFKSSTIYKGDKVLKEGKQLILYAQSLIQNGIDINKIKICWDFLKYCNVSYVQKNGKVAQRQIERAKLGEGMKTSLKTKMKDKGYNQEDIELYLNSFISSNDINTLPEDIISEYEIGDCLVYIPLDKSIIEALNDEIEEKINEIEEKTKEANKILLSGGPESSIEKLFWDSDELLKKQEYFHFNLNGYTREQHKPWDKYLKTKELIQEHKDDMFYTSEDAKTEASNDDLDMSWLDLL